MAFSPTTQNKIHSFFAAEREGRFPDFASPHTGRASSRGSLDTRYDLFRESNLGGVGDFLRLEMDLVSRYRDYEEMDQYPEITTAYDIHADDATQPNAQTGKTVWVDCRDQATKERLDELYDKRLRTEDTIHDIARTIVKYGNDYEEHILKDGEGVLGYNNLPVSAVRRVETRKGGLVGYMYDLQQRFRMSPEELLRVQKVPTDPNQDPRSVSGFFEDFEVQHFRLSSRYRNSVYGFSVGESVRWIWRRLLLFEDAMLLYKLTRAPARFAFYVDVGGLNARQADAHVNRMRMKFRKKRFFDPTTGRLDFRHNPLSFQDDFWLPVRDGGRRSAEIEVLNGPDYQGIDDAEYLRSKLLAGLKVPKLFMNFDSEGTNRTNLATEDVRFARSVLRLQRVLRSGLKRTGNIHLIALGTDPAVVDFDVRMTVPSSIFELAQIEVANAKADLAARMGEFVSRKWIFEKVFNFSESEIEDVMKERVGDQLRQTDVELEIQRKQSELEQEMGATEDKDTRRRIGMQMKRLDGERASLGLARSSDARMERWLSEGRRDSEKRVEDKLNRLLANDLHMRKRLNESRMFMNELRGTLRSAARRAA